MRRPGQGDARLVARDSLLAGLAHRELDDQRAANRTAERALELAEPDQLVLPFVLSGVALATSSVRGDSSSDVTPLTRDAGRQLG